jgi:hypothetical protein
MFAQSFYTLQIFMYVESFHFTSMFATLRSQIAMISFC